jgi:EamA domain-containing membrane protein RarD
MTTPTALGLVMMIIGTWFMGEYLSKRDFIKFCLAALAVVVGICLFSLD